MPGKISVRFTLVGLFVIIRSNMFSRRVGLVTSCDKPLSFNSQGERPGCGSHVKRVDHGDAFNA